MGATPQRWANAAAFRRRSGLSLAVNEELAGDVDTDTATGEQRRRGGLADERFELFIEVPDLAVEVLEVAGDQA